ncbi:hypothetical protein E8E13_001273 [Curvularia kusanoi]|uniref:Uncharacterized protein n=1 Tax=Curvularia kusanoi TaxID=90978 RepID=A0A9P4T5B1_CURKU|nr:hypothetical protein E8E13_001273 [Curvularia kusanoi]
MDNNVAFLTSRLHSQPQSLRPYSILQSPDHTCNTSATPCITPFPRSLIQLRYHAIGTVTRRMEAFAIRALSAFASDARHAQLQRNLVSARLDVLEERQARARAIDFEWAQLQAQLRDNNAQLKRENEELRRELDSLKRRT